MNTTLFKSDFDKLSLSSGFTEAVYAIRCPQVSHGDKPFIKNESLPVWGAWIEINIDLDYQDSVMSLPVWGAWIEIDTGRENHMSLDCRSLYGEH